ncbi:hypothetical protein CC80DRAFT_497964 [Byssothecium circinans]|uniref:DNA helicase n=1 Tax=Byssothecium circinans TaxID=147558 RepID=A0A6A5TDG5_9PLEO|nr:hypothetical protein CC80DRAFT_497964 [Byssothecium circinans]
MYRHDPILSSSPPRARAGSESEDELANPNTFLTQPTQPMPIERSPFFAAPTGTQPTLMLTPQANRMQPYSMRQQPSQVQVARSSPAVGRSASPPASMSQAQPQRRFINPMAPPGTYSQVPPAVTRRPPVDLTSDDPPVEPDSEEEDWQRGSNIAPSKVETQSRASRVEETPQKPSLDLSGFAYNAAYPRKRPGDSFSARRSPPAKKHKGIARQTGPSRAMPVDLTQSDDEKELPINRLEDILDLDMRRKAQRLEMVFPNKTVAQRYNALLKKRGHFDDASSFLADQSDDEPFGPSPEPEPEPQPAASKKTAQRGLNQRLTSLADRYTKTSQAPAPAPAPVEPPGKPKRKGRLVRGRPNRTPSPEPTPKPQSKSKPALPDEDEDEAILLDSDTGSEAGDSVEEVFDDGSLFKFFNSCTIEEMVDLSGQKEEEIRAIFEQRPFKSLAAIEKIHIDLRQKETGKKARKPRYTFGERLVESARNMWNAYETIDSVVKQCEVRGRPMVSTMARWGINIFGGSADGEVAVTKIGSDASGDSGYHSPQSSLESDSDQDNLRKTAHSPKLLKKPSIMNDDIVLKDYQVVGLNWLNLLWNNRISGILADDMGLGKTCQVITFLSHLKETAQAGPHVIIVPGSTLENWAREFEHFSKTINFEIYYGPQNDRMNKQEDILESIEQGNTDVVLTTYDLAFKPTDNKFLRRCRPQMCIFDEGHILRNSTTQRYGSLMKINARCRLLLTGTPLQNSLQELLSILAFLMPDIFNTEAVRDGVAIAFKHKAKVAESDSHGALLSTQRINRARSMMTPFVLRRKKAQVLKDLPKKTCRVEYCELTPMQKKLYNEQLEKQRKILLERAAGNNPKEHMNVMMKLRQAAIHPLLFRERYNDDKIRKMSRACLKEPTFQNSDPNIIFEELELYQDYQCHHLASKYPSALGKFQLKNHEWMDSGKVAKLVQLLKQFKANGDRAILFSQFTSVMDILQWVLDDEDIAYSRIDGSTAISDRQPLIDQFYADEEIPVFMLSTKSGGAGINLACANKVIIFDSSFNPQDDIQAENRAHRVGQTREVEVVRLVTKGTVEEQIHALGISKLELDKMVSGEEGADDVGAGKGKGKKGIDGAGVTAAEMVGIEAVEKMMLEQLVGKKDVEGDLKEKFKEGLERAGLDLSKA